MQVSAHRLFASFLLWEGWSRAFGFGLISLAGFAVAALLEGAAPRVDWIAGGLGLAAAAVDIVCRHPRFFADDSLLDAIRRSHGRGDLAGMMRAEFLVWNEQYMANFALGFLGAVAGADYLVGSTAFPQVIRLYLLFAAVFYLLNALAWRFRTQHRVLAALSRIPAEGKEFNHG